MNKTKKKGFTLAELLIVVAIIAVLVAIAIPVFTAQLEKSREAVDAANIRASYAQIMADAITSDEAVDTTKYSVPLKQEKTGWQTTFDFPENLKPNATTEPAKDATVTFTYADGEVTASIKLK